MEVKVLTQISSFVRDAHLKGNNGQLSNALNTLCNHLQFIQQKSMMKDILMLEIFKMSVQRAFSQHQ